MNLRYKKDLLAISKELSIKSSRKNKDELIEAILEKKKQFQEELTNEEEEINDDTYTEEILQKKQLKKLKEICKELKISQYSKLSKSDLIKLIIKSQEFSITGTSYLFSPKTLKNRYIIKGRNKEKERIKTFFLVFINYK